MGYLGSYWDKLDKVTFFLMIGAIPTGAALVIWIFDRPLRPIIESRGKAPPTPGSDLATEQS